MSASIHIDRGRAIPDADHVFRSVISGPVHLIAQAIQDFRRDASVRLHNNRTTLVLELDGDYVGSLGTLAAPFDLSFVILRSSASARFVSPQAFTGIRCGLDNLDLLNGLALVDGGGVMTNCRVQRLTSAARFELIAAGNNDFDLNPVAPLIEEPLELDGGSLTGTGKINCSAARFTDSRINFDGIFEGNLLFFNTMAAASYVAHVKVAANAPVTFQGFTGSAQTLNVALMTYLGRDESIDLVEFRGGNGLLGRPQLALEGLVFIGTIASAAELTHPHNAAAAGDEFVAVPADVTGTIFLTDTPALRVVEIGGNDLDEIDEAIRDWRRDRANVAGFDPNARLEIHLLSSLYRGTLGLGEVEITGVEIFGRATRFQFLQNFTFRSEGGKTCGLHNIILEPQGFEVLFECRGPTLNGIPGNIITNNVAALRLNNVISDARLQVLSFRLESSNVVCADFIVTRCVSTFINTTGDLTLEFPQRTDIDTLHGQLFLNGRLDGLLTVDSIINSIIGAQAFSSVVLLEGFTFNANQTFRIQISKISTMKDDLTNLVLGLGVGNSAALREIAGRIVVRNQFRGCFDIGTVISTNDPVIMLDNVSNMPALDPFIDITFPPNTVQIVDTLVGNVGTRVATIGGRLLRKIDEVITAFQTFQATAVGQTWSLEIYLTSALYADAIDENGNPIVVFYDWIVSRTSIFGGNAQLDFGLTPRLNGAATTTCEIHDLEIVANGIMPFNGLNSILTLSGFSVPNRMTIASAVVRGEDCVGIDFVNCTLTLTGRCEDILLQGCSGQIEEVAGTLNFTGVLAGDIFVSKITTTANVNSVDCNNMNFNGNVVRINEIITSKADNTLLVNLTPGANQVPNSLIIGHVASPGDWHVWRRRANLSNELNIYTVDVRSPRFFTAVDTAANNGGINRTVDIGGEFIEIIEEVCVQYALAVNALTVNGRRSSTLTINLKSPIYNGGFGNSQLALGSSTTINGNGAILNMTASQTVNVGAEVLNVRINDLVVGFTQNVNTFTVAQGNRFSPVLTNFRTNGVLRITGAANPTNVNMSLNDVIASSTEITDATSLNIRGGISNLTLQRAGLVTIDNIDRELIVTNSSGVINVNHINSLGNQLSIQIANLDNNLLRIGKIVTNQTGGSIITGGINGVAVYPNKLIEIGSIISQLDDETVINTLAGTQNLRDFIDLLSPVPRIQITDLQASPLIRQATINYNDWASVLRAIADFQTAANALPAAARNDSRLLVNLASPQYFSTLTTLSDCLMNNVEIMGNGARVTFLNSLRMLSTASFGCRDLTINIPIGFGGLIVNTSGTGFTFNLDNLISNNNITFTGDSGSNLVARNVQANAFWVSRIRSEFFGEIRNLRLIDTSDVRAETVLETLRLVGTVDQIVVNQIYTVGNTTSITLAGNVALAAIDRVQIGSIVTFKAPNTFLLATDAPNSTLLASNTIIIGSVVAPLPSSMWINQIHNFDYRPDPYVRLAFPINDVLILDDTVTNGVRSRTLDIGGTETNLIANEINTFQTLRAAHAAQGAAQVIQASSWELRINLTSEFYRGGFSNLDISSLVLVGNCTIDGGCEFNINSGQFAEIVGVNFIRPTLFVGSTGAVAARLSLTDCQTSELFCQQLAVNLDVIVSSEANFQNCGGTVAGIMSVVEIGSTFDELSLERIDENVTFSGQLNGTVTIASIYTQEDTSSMVFNGVEFNSNVIRVGTITTQATTADVVNVTNGVGMNAVDESLVIGHVTSPLAVQDFYATFTNYVDQFAWAIVRSPANPIQLISETAIGTNTVMRVVSIGGNDIDLLGAALIRFRLEHTAPGSFLIINLTSSIYYGGNNGSLDFTNVTINGGGAILELAGSLDLTALNGGRIDLNNITFSTAANTGISLIGDNLGTSIFTLTNVTLNNDLTLSRSTSTLQNVSTGRTLNASLSNLSTEGGSFSSVSLDNANLTNIHSTVYSQLVIQGTLGGHVYVEKIITQDDLSSVDCSGLDNFNLTISEIRTGKSPTTALILGNSTTLTGTGRMFIGLVMPIGISQPLIANITNVEDPADFIRFTQPPNNLMLRRVNPGISEHYTLRSTEPDIRSLLGPIVEYQTARVQTNALGGGAGWTFDITLAGTEHHVGGNMNANITNVSITKLFEGGPIDGRGSDITFNVDGTTAAQFALRGLEFTGIGTLRVEGSGGTFVDREVLVSNYRSESIMRIQGCTVTFEGKNNATEFILDSCSVLQRMGSIGRVTLDLPLESTFHRVEAPLTVNDPPVTRIIVGELYSSNITESLVLNYTGSQSLPIFVQKISGLYQQIATASPVRFTGTSAEFATLDNGSVQIGTVNAVEVAGNNLDGYFVTTSDAKLSVTNANPKVILGL